MACWVAQMVKNSPAVQETPVWFLGWKDLLEKEKATHSSIRAWRISQTEKPGGLQSMGVTKSQTRLSDYHFPTINCLANVAAHSLKHLALPSSPNLIHPPRLSIRSLSRKSSSTILAWAGFSLSWAQKELPVHYPPQETLSHAIFHEHLCLPVSLTGLKAPWGQRPCAVPFCPISQSFRVAHLEHKPGLVTPSFQCLRAAPTEARYISATLWYHTMGCQPVEILGPRSLFLGVSLSFF